MKYDINIITATLLVMLLPTTYSCTNDKEEQMVRDRATTFANAYFNNKYNDAIHNATAESEKWIRYVAGNLTQEDLDKINASDDTSDCVVTDLQQENDTTASTTLAVTNAFIPDTIGKTCHMISKGNVHLTLKKRNGLWAVHLNNVPQILTTNK